MNILGSLLKLIFGSNLQGNGVRVSYIALLALGWVFGDRYGVPAPLEGIVDSAFIAVGDTIDGVLPGSDSVEAETPASE